MTYSFEQMIVCFVIDPSIQGHIQRIVLPISMADIFHITCPWEKVAILMKRDCHDSVRAIESLLDPIPMMHVNVNVENSIVILQQFQDSQYYVIDIAKPARLHLLGMMQPASPVNADIRRLMIEFDGCIEGSPR